MNWILHTWSLVWPNLVASLIAFTTGSAWHLVLVRRALRHHQDTIDRRLTAHERALNLTDQEDKSDRQRN